MLPLIATIALLGAASAARADGSPNISAALGESTTLYGDPVPMTVSASNPEGEPYAYNLSFRVVLPEGVGYAGGAPVAPTEIADRPSAGETTLIFSNVSDLSPNATREIGFALEYDQAIWDAGQSFPVEAEAFVNGNARYVPDFDAFGEPIGPETESFTGYAAASGMQTLKPIEVEIEEPSPEGEILRGVHDHQTVFTLKVINNGVNPTTGTQLDAYVPAGLEFLGCGGAGADNTTDAPTNPGSAEEYPGSGPIVVEPLAGCVEPNSVETVFVDPDGESGPLPEAVYTHVIWPVGTLADGETKLFPYRAAVPIRENTDIFTGTRPSAASGEQATNLDNNDGDEVLDEAPLQTYATVSGLYEGDSPFEASDDASLERSAEDWVVHKKADGDVLAQGQITEWTLTFETGEYKFIENATVTDTVPSGLCPLGPVNYTTQNTPDDSECAPQPGAEPSAPYAAVTENADGTFTVLWNSTSLAALGHTGVSDEFTITFPTKTRVSYQQDFESTTPILTFDAIGNEVETEGEGWARCLAPEAPDCASGGTDKVSFDGTDGSVITDASAAEQEATGPSIDKQVAASGTDCQAATYVDTIPVYHPGDRVCWRVRVDFPGAVDTSPQATADYLPAGVTYEPGSDEETLADNVISTIDESNASDGLLTWTVEGSVVPAGSQVFEHVFSTIATPSGSAGPGDLTGNLLKFSSVNTPGESTPQRAEAEFAIQMPLIDLVKGVEEVVRDGVTVDGPNGPNADGKEVQADDEVTYRVDVTNDGGQDAVDIEVWDFLPADFDCSEVTEISADGECTEATPRDRVSWVIPSLAEGGGTSKLNYTVAVPGDIGPDRNLVNDAGVRGFAAETNLGGTYQYTPVDNIDPENEAVGNAPAADDPSNVFTADADVAKTRTTSVTESGNNAASQATIGETVTYTVTATIPEGTTLGGEAELTDTLETSARQAAVPGSVEATLNGGELPPGFVVDALGPAPKVTFPADYVNLPGSGDDELVLRFQVVVTDVGANTRGTSLGNLASLAWTDPVTGEEGRNSPKVSTTIVEPVIAQAKSDDVNPGTVQPGEIVTYTLTTSNSGAANVSTAHSVAIVDEVPAGLIPVGAAPANEPLADGAAVPGSEGAVWDEDARTITKTVATLAPGATTDFSYRAEVEKPAVAGATLTNTVEATTASLGAAVTGRRTSGVGYLDSAEDTIYLAGASIVKQATPGEATPGESLRYELTVTIPANLDLFDTTVVDSLPAGVQFDAYVDAECVSGCPLANPIQYYAPQVDGGSGAQRIAWDLGDIPALPEPQVVKLTYDAHLLASERVSGNPVLAGEAQVNTAGVGSNLTDDGGTFDPDEIPGEFEEYEETDSTLTVVEPEVTLDKQIKVGDGAFGDGPATAHSDDQLTYRLIVTNGGDSPAYDVEVNDVLDPALTNVAVVAQAGVAVTEPWSEATNEMALEIAGPIAPGESVTIEYTADFIAASELSDGQQVPNVAAVPLAYGVSEDGREEHPGREYVEYFAGPDEVEAVLDFPSFAIAKTTGLEGNPETGDAQVNQPFPWRIVVTNSSPTAGASGVEVADVLPPNWKYVAGSTELSTGDTADPTVVSGPLGDRLAWTIATLDPEESVTILFDARPLLAAADDPGTGAEANVNISGVAAALDEAGNSGNAEGPYGSPPDTASATLRMPELTLDKAVDGEEAVAGEEATYTIEIDNDGAAPARNLVVTDLMPGELTYTPGSATALPADGFSETGIEPGPGGSYTVKWSIAELGAGDSVTITVPVTVKADTPAGTTLANDAAVTSDEVTEPVEDVQIVNVETEADVAIAKSGAAGYTPGEKYTWQLRVQNLGPSDAENVVVTDALPAGAVFDSADSPCDEGFADVVSCSLGTLAPGFDQTYEITVDVQPDVEADPLDNTAEVTTDTDDPDSSNDESTFGPTPDASADVWIEKTANPTSILKGHEATFTLKVGNDGPSTARDVTITDPLPAGLELVSTDEPPCTNTAGTVGCEFGDLAPGAEESVQVTVRGTANGTHVNTATVSTTTPEPPVDQPNIASAEVTVNPVAELEIEKTGPATVAAGGELTWTLLATNNGPDPASGVTITDTLPEGVELVSASPDCTEAAGVVSCAIGALAVDASVEREITVTVPVALADTTIVNTATVAGNEGDDLPANDSDEAETEVGPSADLSIEKTGPARMTAGNAIAWTLTVRNGGPSAATGVAVEDVLPAGVELSSAKPTQGSCAPAGDGVACQLGTLANGGSARIEIVAQVGAAYIGTLRNEASVGADEPDPNPANDDSSATTTVDPPPAKVAPSGFDLSISKRIDGAGKPRLGDVVRYEILVANLGPAAASAVKVTDELPGSVKFVSARIAGGECSRAGSVVSCELAQLAAGAQARATIAVRALAAGPLVNVARVAAAGDADPGNNRSAASTRVVLGKAKLTLKKWRVGKGPVEPGERVRFRIVVRNAGKSPAAGTVVCDRLPASMSFVKRRGAELVRGEACWTVEMLPAGAKRAFNLTARLAAGFDGAALRNVAYVKADNAPKRRGVAAVQVKADGAARGGGVTG